jgi:hypothetical protein
MRCSVFKDRSDPNPQVLPGARARPPRKATREYREREAECRAILPGLRYWSGRRAEDGFPRRGSGGAAGEREAGELSLAGLNHAA